MAVAAPNTSAEVEALVRAAQMQGPHGWLLRGEAPPMPRGAEALGAWYDEAAAEKAVAFFPRYLRHVEGEWAGQSFELDPWEESIVRQVFGWKLPDGTRLIRTVYIEIPRKNGKTSFAAGLALLLLLGDGEPAGQGYSMAVDREQAKLLYTKACQMVAGSPELSESLEVYKTSIFCPALQASLKPLGKGAANKHGFSPSFAVGDEVHEWADGDMADVVHKGMAARRQPLEVYITTSGVRGRGYGWELHQYARQVEAGDVTDPQFLGVIYGAEEDEDWTDEAVLAKANPNLGRSVKIEFLRAECRKAQTSPRLENEYRRFHLDQWTEQAVRWLPMISWRKCTSRPEISDYWRDLESLCRGRTAFGGIDVGAVRDVSALVWVFPPRDESDRLVVLPRFWVPRASVKDRVERFLVPYDGWSRAGALKITEGNATDFAAIREQVLSDASLFKIESIGVDPWNAMQLLTELEGEGAPVQQVRQGFGSLASPTRELERLVIEETELEHGGHPVLAWMAGNAVVRQDPAGNIKPDKERAVEKIDGIVATVMALALYQAAEAPPPAPVAVWV